MSTYTTGTRRFGPMALLLTLAFLMPLTSGCSNDESATGNQAAAPQTTESAKSSPAPDPTAKPETTQTAAQEPAAGQSASADGKKIYQQSCQSCHATGAAGAPKLEDKEAWAPRIAKGQDALFSSVKNGLNAMPPKGACMSCSDDDLRAAVAHMVNESS
ncbi:MAG: c-type cytochrome [Gammaproteobacteria bacterium]|nr:c-type cytochrome [Gammaproteobacteria bacterium]